MSEMLRNRVQARLDAMGIGAVKAATSAGLERTYIRDIVEGRKRTVTARLMPKLASALQTSPAFLLGETNDPNPPQPSQDGGEEVRPIPGRLIPIPKVGRTEAGEFREILEFDDDEKDIILERPDDEFPRAKMTAFEVAGDSMNAASPPIIPGSTIVVVDFDDTGLPLIDGMIVVLERTRNGGLTREWSVKEVVTFDDRVEYHPRSTNIKHKPIIVPYQADPNDGQEVRVLGLVRRISIDVPKYKIANR